jgi:hypothetical protein
MSEIIAVLRYFPLGTLAGPALPLTRTDLDAVAAKYAVSIQLQEVQGKNAIFDGIGTSEETMNCAIEEITQSVITLSAVNESAGAKALREIIRKYRAPRTVFGCWGSNQKGRFIVARICEEDDGWR